MRASLLLVAPLLFVSCADHPATAILLAASADAGIPAELTKLEVTVHRSDSVFDETYALPRDADLPGTLTLADSSHGKDGTPMSVALHATLVGGHFIERSAELGFIEEHTKLLRLRLEYPCIDVICAPGQTCDEGACVADTIDASTLPDTDGSNVFDPPGCFDAAMCLEALTPVPLACTFASGAAGSSNINVAAMWKFASHVVPLPSSSIAGFTVQNGTVTLGAIACKAVQEGRILALAVSSNCPTYHAGAVVCADDPSTKLLSNGTAGASGQGGASGHGGTSGTSGTSGGGQGGAAGVGGHGGAAGASGGMSGASGKGGNGGASGHAGASGMGASGNAGNGTSGNGGNGLAGHAGAGTSGNGGAGGSANAGAGGQSGSAGNGMAGNAGAGGASGSGGVGGISTNLMVQPCVRSLMPPHTATLWPRQKLSQFRREAQEL